MSDEKFLIFYREKGSNVPFFERVANGAEEAVRFINEDGLIQRLSKSQDSELVISKTSIVLDSENKSFKMRIARGGEQGAGKSSVYEDMIKGGST